MHNCPIRESQIQDNTFEKAIRKGYLIVGRGKKYNKFYNEFWKWCKKNNRPFIVITTRTKYADVKIDLWCTNFNFKKCVLPGLKQAIYKYLPIGTYYGVSETFSWASNVRLGDTEALAKKFLSFYKPENLTTHAKDN